MEIPPGKGRGHRGRKHKKSRLGSDFLGLESSICSKGLSTLRRVPRDESSAKVSIFPDLANQNTSILIMHQDGCIYARGRGKVLLFTEIFVYLPQENSFMNSIGSIFPFDKAIR